MRSNSGKTMLQEKLSSYGNGEMTKTFTTMELQRETNNYNQSMFLSHGGYGKGVQRNVSGIVTVKKSKQFDSKKRLYWTTNSHRF
jgi:hypothetical protein